MSTLTLLLAPSANAGGWVATYQSNGQFDNTHYNYDNTSSIESTPWPNPWSGYFPDASFFPSPTPTCASSGDITTTLTWTPTSPTDQPPADQQHSLSVLEDASATAQWHGPGATPADVLRVASDGLDDPAVVNYDTPQADTLVSRGKHLITVPVTQGADGVWRAVLPTRHLAASGARGAESWIMTVPIAYTAQQDTRAVTISSSLEPTYYKDSNTGNPVLNQSSGDGTMHADTVFFDENDSTYSSQPVDYFAHPVGAWSDNSSYHWYSALTGASPAGTFTLPDDPPDHLYQNYIDAGIRTGPLPSQEHINLHCVDGGISPEASANYYVSWHDEFEDWITLVDYRQNGPIVRVTGLYRPGTNDTKFGQELTNSVKITIKATGEGALDIQKIASKFGAELGAEYETSTTTKVEYTMVANKVNWLERQTFWRHREGTVDNYGVHGYLGLLHWSLDSAYNPGTPTIDFEEYQRFSDADPAY